MRHPTKSLAALTIPRGPRTSAETSAYTISNEKRNF
jgi:hypothetical protein